MKSVKFFEEGILQFYEEYGRRHLPWRKKRITAYSVWVSEIMLQQTQVDRVINFYKRFLKRFPTVEKLAEASWEEFLPYYQGLGYYNRGRNMLSAARIVCENYCGRFPRDVEKLEKLPGIGVYTARAIASFAHADNHLAWDTNFQRVFGRYFFGSKDTSIHPKDFEGKIKENKRDFNGAIMDFGSLVCMNKPKCDICPLRSRCAYFQEAGKKERVTTHKQKAFPMREADVLVFLHKDHKVYYSEGGSKYRPFRVPKSHNTRAGIKQYFQDRYKLTLSIRPPHKKVFVREKPVILVNAQVLLGKPRFQEYAKQAVKGVMEELRN